MYPVTNLQLQATIKKYVTLVGFDRTSICAEAQEDNHEL